MTNLLSPSEVEAREESVDRTGGDNGIPMGPLPPSDPLESAKAAGLQYVTDEEPGIRRRREGDDFIYVGTNGRVIGDPDELRRFQSLGIPPACTDVWICPLPNGHLQATGRDAKGRKQYRYHSHWREVRDQTKFH